MRAVLQRVSEAAVEVSGEPVAGIGRGLLVLLAVEKGDDDEELAWTARKIGELRIFQDEERKMNRSVSETGGEVLLVSQFTLAADVRKGRRPSFDKAEGPERAEALLKRLAGMLGSGGLVVKMGRFGAHMRVRLVNDGPVTIILEKRPGAAP